MASIGNFQEAYTSTVWRSDYGTFWQSAASRIYPGATYTEREERRIEDLEREIRELNMRVMELEGILWWNNNDILSRLDALEKSAWFSYIDLNKW